MKRIINVLHFGIMSVLYMLVHIAYAGYIVKLILVLFGIADVFTWKDWLIFLLSQSVVINCYFIVRYKSVMDLFGFPFDEKTLLP